MKQLPVKRLFPFLVICVAVFSSNEKIFAQCTAGASTAGNSWARGGNTGANNYFGSLTAGVPICIFTGGTNIARFTTGNSLTNPAGLSGDGLRIIDPVGGIGNLDLWTSTSNTTHIKWDGSGEISGQNNRLEVIGNYSGLWLNADPPLSRIFFNINGTECGRFNTGANNRFMRIGLNPGSLDAARRLEVFDVAGVPQFRITQTSGVNFTDFQTTGAGYLGILPSGLRTGIGIITPTNTLDVNGTCRIRNLASVPQTDVVVTDANGVLYREPLSSITTGFGGPCGNLPVLIANAGVNLNGNNFHFVGTQFTSAVGIGTNCNSILMAKLTVLQSSGLNFGTIAGSFLNTDISGTATVYGIQSVVNPTAQSFLDIGYTAGFFGAHGSKINIGVDALADGPAGFTGNIGGRFIAQNGVSNIGVWGEALPPSGNTPPTGPNYAGFFNGDVVRTGTDNFTSDANLKTSINPINDPWTILSQLIPKSFYFDSVSHPYLGLSRRKQYGFIAQDVEPFLPELVTNVIHPARFDSLGNMISPGITYKTLNYQAFIGLIMAGMKQMKQQLDSLTQQNNNLRLSGNSNLPTTNVTLENPSALLFQNSPNPAGDFTSINYILPEKISNAEIVFYDEFGNEINRTVLHDRGKAKIDVDLKSLASGIYSYSLVVDGKFTDSKKMIRAK